MAPLFWKLLAAACLVWYSSVTVYVAVRGFRDIREMLKRLKQNKEQPTPACSCQESQKPE